MNGQAKDLAIKACFLSPLDAGVVLLRSVIFGRALLVGLLFGQLEVQQLTLGEPL